MQTADSQVPTYYTSHPVHVCLNNKFYYENIMRTIEQYHKLNLCRLGEFPKKEVQKSYMLSSKTSHIVLINNNVTTTLIRHVVLCTAIQSPTTQTK